MLRNLSQDAPEGPAFPDESEEGRSSDVALQELWRPPTE